MFLSRGFSIVAVLCVAALPHMANAQYTPYFFDGYDVSTATEDINFEIATTRQGGAPAPISYVTNVDPAADPPQTYKHQMFDADAPLRVLQLAEDATNVVVPGEGPAPTMVSPDFNFDGTLPNGDIIGKRITFDLDVAAFLPAFDLGQVAWTFAGVTVGGDSTLIDDVDSNGFLNGDPVADHFSLRFIHDRFSLNTEFVQAYEFGATIFDNTGCIGCFLNHEGGTGLLSVQIDIDDPEDGNPWDGVGSTVIQASVNGDPIRNPNNGEVWTYVRGDGGLTDNYITLFGKQQTWNNTQDPEISPALATHLVDNFTVWSAPLFPVVLEADINGDGQVDGEDFNLIQQQNPSVIEAWQREYSAGTTSAAAAASAVPEPASVVLLGGLITVLGWRRTRSIG